MGMKAQWRGKVCPLLVSRLVHSSLPWWAPTRVVFFSSELSNISTNISLSVKPLAQVLCECLGRSEVEQEGCALRVEIPVASGF